MTAFEAWAEDGFVQNPHFPPDDNVLSPPIVGHPIYECTTLISVAGAVPGASITLFKNGMAVQTSAASEGSATFSLSVKEDDVLTALQTLGPAQSTQSKPVAVRDHSIDYPNGIEPPRVYETNYDCGAVTVVYSPAWGTSVRLDSQTYDPATGAYSPPAAIDTLSNVGPPGVVSVVSKPFSEKDQLSAIATLCTDTSARSDYQVVLADPQPLSQPKIGDIIEGQELVAVTNLASGAKVTLTDAQNAVLGTGYAAGKGTTVRIASTYVAGTKIYAAQQLCGSPSITGETTILACSTMSGPEMIPPQAGEELVSFKNYVPGSRITIFDGAGKEVGDGSGPTVMLTRALKADDQLFAVQSLNGCESLTAYHVTINCSVWTAPFPCGATPCVHGVFPGSCWRPYGPVSAFNRVVPPSPRLRPNSDNIVKHRIRGAPNYNDLSALDQPQSLWVRTDHGSGWPTYYGVDTDPEFTIACTEYGGNCDVKNYPGRAPAGAAAQQDSTDKHLTFVDQSKTPLREFDLYHVASTSDPLPSSGTITTGFSGHTLAMAGDGRAIRVGQGNAGRVGNLAGRIRAEELADAMAKNTYINHALAINVLCTSGETDYPAGDNKGRQCMEMEPARPAEDAPPMGARLWLSMPIEKIDSPDFANVPPWKKVLLRTLIKYGAIVIDTGTEPDLAYWAWHFESGNQYVSMGSPDAWLAVSATAAQQGDVTAATDGYGYRWDNVSDGINWSTEVWDKLAVLDQCESAGTCDEWYYRESFLKLPEWSGGAQDLRSFVASIPHPAGDSFHTIAEQDADFAAFAGALLAGAYASAEHPSPVVDWCGIKAAADNAGYDIYRLHHVFKDSNAGINDSAWLVYAHPRNSDDAHFFFNPSAKRNVIIEVPHGGTESGVVAEGARIMLEVGAFGLFVNGHDRCGTALTPETPTCKQGQNATTACGGQPQEFRVSDVAHATNNAFHGMHASVAGLGAPAGGAVARFISLHGKSAENHVDVSDGASGTALAGVSHDLSDALVALNGLDESVVFRCQEEQINDTDTLCGTFNVQGISVNAPNNQCSAVATSSSNRFLHVEQPPSFRNNHVDDLIQAFQTMAGAMGNQFRACDLGSSPSDCAPEINQLAPTPNPNLKCP